MLRLTKHLAPAFHSFQAGSHNCSLYTHLGSFVASMHGDGMHCLGLLPAAVSISYIHHDELCESISRHTVGWRMHRLGMIAAACPIVVKRQAGPAKHSPLPPPHTARMHACLLGCCQARPGVLVQPTASCSVHLTCKRNQTCRLAEAPAGGGLAAQDRACTAPGRFAHARRAQGASS